jgi:hypothetical protein
MMTKGIIAVAAAFMLALTVGILTANMAESGNDRLVIQQSARFRCNTR